MGVFKNRHEVCQAVENEGLEYFIKGYCSGQDMPDDKTKELFYSLEIAIDDFREHIGLE